MFRCGGYYAECTKSGTERQVLHDHTVLWNLERTKPLKQRLEQMVVTRPGGAGRARNKEMLGKGCNGSSHHKPVIFIEGTIHDS